MPTTFDRKKYARERAEARASGSWLKLKEGENRFRILPTPTENDQPEFLEYAMHRDVGPRKLGVRCGIDPVTQEGSCWLCEVKIPELRKKGLETRATALAAKPVFLIQVAKVDDEGQMRGPFLFTPAKTLADQILATIFGNKRRDYSDPKKGYDIFVSRTGTGRNDTRYGSIEPNEEPSEVPKSILKKLLSFDELKEVPKYSSAKQKAVYAGKDVIDEEEEDDMPKEKLKHRTKPVVEPDEEDEEEEEETEASDDEDTEDEDEESEEEESEEEEDEEEEPVKKKKLVVKAKVKTAPVKKKKRPEPEEDEEDEEEAEDEPEEEDEEEEEEPVKKKKLKAAPAVKKKKKPEPEPEEEDEEEEDEDEEDKDLDDIPDEDEEEEEEEEPEPTPKKTKTIVKNKVAKKKVRR